MPVRYKYETIIQNPQNYLKHIATKSFLSYKDILWTYILEKSPWQV